MMEIFSGTLHAFSISKEVEMPLFPQGDIMTAPFRLFSVAFQHEGQLSPRYTCEGEAISPPLQWENVPHGTKSLVLIIDDPDAPDPDAPKRTWVHWVVYNIPPEAPGLEEGVQQLPKGAKAGMNDWQQPEYGSPCPPIGRHRYFFKLYALDSVLPDLGHPTKHKLLKAMRNHLLAEATLMATYAKKELDLRVLQSESTNQPNP